MMDFKILAVLLREMAGNCYLKFIQLMIINQILNYRHEEEIPSYEINVNSAIVVKEPACQYKRHKRRGSDPCVGKVPWRRLKQERLENVEHGGVSAECGLTVKIYKASEKYSPLKERQKTRDNDV